MVQLQKQLNQQIQQLKKSGKSGKQMSRDLAKLAAEQEIIRNAMQRMMQGQGSSSPNGNPMNQNQKGNQKGEKGTFNKDGEEGKRYQELLEMMESTEEDLVNKRLTQKMLQRQKEIMTRLLESEKASRERKLDKERESKSAKEIDGSFKDQLFEEYFKEKKSQIELLKTLPPNLNLYYKNQIDRYFKD